MNNRMGVVTAGAVGVAMVIGGIFFFRKLYDTSEIEADAKSLVGKPVARIHELLGLPSKTLTANEFNTQERADIRSSYVPKDVPTARGSVFVYNHIPTLIVLFESRGIIEKVYVGKT